MKTRGKRRRKSPKPTAILLISVAVFAVALGIYGIWQQKRSAAPVDANAAAKLQDMDTSGNSIMYEGKTYVYNEKLSNFLFLGIDRRDMEEKGLRAGQADVVFLLSWNRVTKDMTLISIPRDTMADIEVFGTDGKSLGKTRDHINLAYAYGDGKHKSCTLMKTAVSDLFYGLPIQGYCSIHMDGIPVLVSAVDGVTITLADDSLASVNESWTAGSQITLDESNVESFVRYRDTNQTFSAMDRLERQKLFIHAWGEKAQEVYRADTSFAGDLYDALTPHMVTNVGNDQFIKMLESVDAGGTVTSWTLPGENVAGQEHDEYHVDDAVLYRQIIETFYIEA